MIKTNKFHLNPNGQALTEMLLVIPMLFLMTAGMVQFAFLFMAKTSFEHACGQAARDYAGQKIDPTIFSDDIWRNLGTEQRFFNKETLLAVPSPTSSLVAQTFLGNIDILGPLISKIKSSLLNYSGKKWTVVIFFKSAPFFGVVFPAGIPFQTELAILKYPGQD